MAGKARAKLRPVSRVAALQYKFYDRIRHPRAFELARRPGTAHDFSAFRRARQCLVVTFKRSGAAVPAPVNFGLSGDDRLYFRAEPHTAKIKRLLTDPHVRICPCNFRGKPLGPVTEATGRIVRESEVDHAYSVVASNWSAAMTIFERIMDRTGVPLVYVEITSTTSAS
jgi:PPOX class probable F420-dependent enzyme